MVEKTSSAVNWNTKQDSILSNISLNKVFQIRATKREILHKPSIASVFQISPLFLFLTTVPFSGSFHVPYLRSVQHLTEVPFVLPIEK